MQGAQESRGAHLGNLLAKMVQPFDLGSPLGPSSHGIMHLGKSSLSNCGRGWNSVRANPPGSEIWLSYQRRVQACSPALTVCGIWVQSFNLSDPPFFICKIGIIIGIVGGVMRKEITYTKNSHS